ncbi:hypothetical protein E2C01_067934 [Portunus trituberculatus]|uniref:Uncharacterized protein n=1 Tax=Portunus trituberculatus TaxID=210409 RepID=A0A5B7HME9_PORTR|nr:hypothetical protein [Portunus trituberculatus]
MQVPRPRLAVSDGDSRVVRHDLLVQAENGLCIRPEPAHLREIRQLRVKLVMGKIKLNKIGPLSCQSPCRSERVY